MPMSSFPCSKSSSASLICSWPYFLVIKLSTSIRPSFTICNTSTTSFAHFEDHVAWNRNVFGETADVPTGDRRAVGFSERRRRRTIDAEVFTPPETIAAASALVAHADDNRVSFLKELRRARADSFDGAGAFMTQDRRGIKPVTPLDDFKIG